MDMAQEIAYWAAHELGFGYDDLHVHHTAWVLSRLHFHFEKLPMWRDDVRLYTWHKGADGLFYLRDFILQDADGNGLVTGTSSWVVIDEETRRLVRPEELQDKLNTGCADDAIPERAPKVAMPRGAEPEPAGEHVVLYSDIDIIGHTNNARYMVWAMDCLDYETVSTRRVRDAYINFNKETTPGVTVQLFRLKTEEDGALVWYVEGRVDGKSAFCVKLVF
jgi:acyl-ACP thioesterase